MSDRLHFEDIEIGSSSEWGAYELTEAEIVEMAARFDPQPWHLDHEAAKASVFGELVACACHLHCVMSALHNENPRPLALVAGLGVKEHRMRAPGRIGDVVRLRNEFLTKRVSATRPTTGIVDIRNEMVDGDGRVIVDNIGTVLVHRRAPGTAKLVG